MLQKIELRTLSPKKWLLSLYGEKPTIDENYTGIKLGCFVGDFVIDTGSDTPIIWQCIDQTPAASDFILVYPKYYKTSSKISDYTVNINTDYLIPVNANTNDITITLPVGVKIDGKASIQLNVQYESISLHSAYNNGKEIIIKRTDNSSHKVYIVPAGSNTNDNWYCI